MAFLSKKLIEKEPVVIHPLLKELSLSLGARVAYLQGCVLATLLDDANISPAELQGITALGRSLELSEDDIDECVGTVKALTSEADQDIFLQELKNVLSDRVAVKFFMADFERLMQKPEGLSAEANEALDYIGRRLIGGSEWREAIDGKVSSVGIAQNHADKTNGTGAEMNSVQGVAHGSVEFWLSRVPSVAMAEIILHIIIKMLPTAKAYPDWALGQIKEVIRTGNAICLERAIAAEIAVQILSELRGIGADGFVKGHP